MIWCLHGAFGSYSDWGFLEKCEALVDWEVRAVNLWQDFPKLSYGEWAREWADVVASEDKNPVVVGYSMGGRLALHALLARPELWQAAVIVSAHPGLIEAAARRDRAQVDEAWLKRLGALDWASFQRAWEAQTVFAGKHRLIDWPPFHPAMERSLLDWSLARQENLLDQLAGLSLPVLWVVGEHDAKYVEIGRRVARALPFADLEIAPAGHRVPWEWKAFAETLATFLRGL